MSVTSSKPEEYILIFLIFSLTQAKDEEDSAAAAKRKKTPEVAASAGGRSSLLLRAAVGAVEADGAAEAAEKVFEGGFFSVRSPATAARSPLQRITPTNTPCGGGSSTSNSREDDDGLISAISGLN